MSANDKVRGADEIEVRLVRPGDLDALGRFACSTGPEWEAEVEAEVRTRLGRRYLASSDPDFDARLLVFLGSDGVPLAVGAHRVERVLVRIRGAVREIRPTYLEVIAVELNARGRHVDPGDGGDPMTFGEFVFDVITRDACERRRRDPLIFGRVDRRNRISLEFCDRVGLTVEQPDENRRYVQRWADLFAGG